VVVGGSPFLISTIINGIGETPWPWYAISFFMIALSSAVESFLLFFTNEEVKRIVVSKCGIPQGNEHDVGTNAAVMRVIPLYTDNRIIQTVSVMTHQIETRSA
jgi:hypothetical protein